LINENGKVSIKSISLLFTNICLNILNEIFGKNFISIVFSLMPTLTRRIASVGSLTISLSCCIYLFVLLSLKKIKIKKN